MLENQRESHPKHRQLKALRVNYAIKVISMDNESLRDEEVSYNMTSYLRIIAAASVKSRASEVLDKREKAMAYSKMDGSTSQAKIASTIGVPAKTISNWADDFVRHHLAVAPSKYNSSHKALFSLEDLDIEISGLKKQYQSKNAEQIVEATKTKIEENGDING